MLSSGFKKLASECGMQTNHGIAYGQMRGYATTLCEGNGYKYISIATTIADAQNRVDLQNALEAGNIKKEFRVRDLDFSSKHITVIFQDTIGTMKKITAFIDWFFPLLEQFGASKMNVCVECGCEITSGCWKLINGTAYYVHQSCGDKIKRNITADEESRKQQDTGSYATGAIGAVLGAILGAIVWALVLHFGYVASIVGLLIGFLAERGYTLLKGKRGKAKTVIIGLVVILGVVLGTFLADAFTVVELINDGEALSLTYGDIPGFLSRLFQLNSEYRTEVFTNIGLGLLFAGLGAFGILRQTSIEASGTKVIDLP